MHVSIVDAAKKSQLIGIILKTLYFRILKQIIIIRAMLDVINKYAFSR